MKKKFKFTCKSNEGQLLIIPVLLKMIYFVILTSNKAKFDGVKSLFKGIQRLKFCEKISIIMFIRSKRAVKRNAKRKEKSKKKMLVKMFIMFIIMFIVSVLLCL